MVFEHCLHARDERRHGHCRLQSSSSPIITTVLNEVSSVDFVLEKEDEGSTAPEPYRPPDASDDASVESRIRPLFDIIVAIRHGRPTVHSSLCDPAIRDTSQAHTRTHASLRANARAHTRSYLFLNLCLSLSFSIPLSRSFLLVVIRPILSRIVPLHARTLLLSLSLSLFNPLARATLSLRGSLARPQSDRCCCSSGASHAGAFVELSSAGTSATPSEQVAAPAAKSFNYLSLFLFLPFSFCRPFKKGMKILH